MKLINANIAEQNLIIEPSVISVAESVNAYSLKITYDEQWEALDTKVITFTAANGTSLGVLDNDEENGVVIPWEVIRCPGKVSVGVVGYAGTELKLTTTGLYNRNTFVVLPNAFGLATAITPTPDIYQKLLQTIEQFNDNLEETNEKIGDLDDLKTEDKDNLVAAINELLNGGGSSGTVKSVNSVEPDSDGNVSLSASDVGAVTTEELENAIAEEVINRTTADAGLKAQIDGTEARLGEIEEKIPAQASAQNQLADKDFVNSSVATNTAYYISSNGEPFASFADLEAYSGTLTNNDYAFVVGTDEAGNTTYTRYKYNADTETWAEEYVLNNSSFTAEQWATIQSGITSQAVSKLNGIEAGAEVNAIDSISINGVVQAPDEHKNIDLPANSVRVLSSKDYDFPTNAPDGVAAWSLPDGIYIWTPGTRIYSSSNRRGTYPGTFLMKNSTADPPRVTIFSASSSDSKMRITVTDSSGTFYQTASLSAPLDYLNSTDATAALSANQGRILKGLIDASAIPTFTNAEFNSIFDTNLEEE